MAVTPGQALVQAALRRREDVPPAQAEARVSAYVYGNVLVLAAVVGCTADVVASGAAVAVVVGTVVSTYLAHVLADSIGSLFAGHGGATALTRELRDAVPIPDSGVLPAVLLVAGAVGWLPVVAAQSAAAGVTVVRIAGIGFVYRRLRPETSAHRAWVLGLAAAGVAVVVAVLKLTLTH